MNYYDTNIAAIQTSEMLRLRGLPDDPEQLALLAIFEIAYEPPTDYNHMLYTVVPDKDPIAVIRPSSKPKLKRYTQNYLIVELDVSDGKSNLKEAITAHRYDVETGGITLSDGTLLHTKAEDRNSITNILQNAIAAHVTTIDFKAATRWLVLTIAELTAISGLVEAHVQACFSNEHKLHMAVDQAMTIPDLEKIDILANWPACATTNVQ